MRAGVVMVMAALSFGLVLDAAAQPTEAQLKARFRERLPAVRTLKDAGKIGETIEGALAPVGESYLSETVNVGGTKVMVKQLIGAENQDRTALYMMIAKRTNEPVQEVAKQAAIRNYREASPSHYLRLKDGRWAQKKSIATEPAG